MQIFIKKDEFKKISSSIYDKLLEISNEMGIDVTEDIENADIIISIGGDGTFLKTARLSDGKPIVGVNTGTLGYLTEISPDEIKEALADIKNGNYLIEERMMVDGEIKRTDGNVIEIPESLNEIAISKNTFGVLRFDAIVNGKLINSYNADGIMVYL